MRPELQMLNLVHRPHPALPERTHNPVVADNVFFVENPSQLNQLRNKQFYSISIVAGASTPPWLIQEVTKLMSETLNNTVEVKEEATLQEQATAAEKELTMEDIVKSDRAMGYANYKKGKKYDGIVLNADENGIYVGMQIGKKDGFIDKADAEVDGSYDPANYKKGDSISAIYTGESNKDYILLSKKEVDLKVLEDAEAEKALADGEFDLTISEVVKGGLRGRLGSYTVFVPASHVKMGYVKNLEDYKGKTLHVVQLTEENAEGEDEKASKKRFIVASAKKYLEREKQAKEDEFWNNIHIHDIVTGKVKRFTQFGAFVSVKGFDCLAHISELSWNKITDPSTVLTIGESYDFVVLKMDRATGKISLGYKQLQKKPYEAAAERFPVGTVIKGKVERIFSYGAFISICEGVDGLVHVSQISHNWIKDANEILKVGEEVEAKIIGFEENRITLSIKELLPAPEVAEEAPAAEAEAEATEKPKKNARIKKFEEKVAEGEEKRERRPRKAAAETSAEPKEFISGSSSASLGDLFKGLMLDLEAEEAAEEAPKKKATRKKKTEDAE
jgi:4-hydroxy-3-methylbut-2-enyl diphosphate reductase